MGTFHQVTSTETKMNSLFSILAISLVVFVSEACWPPPPPPPATTTTAKPDSSTAAPPTTTTGPTYKCPIGGLTGKGDTCVTGDNLLKLEASTNPEDCNKKCTDYANSECKFWSFVPTRKLCFLLKSCTKKAEEGTVSGEKGCKVPSKSFTLFNLIDADLTDCEVKFEPAATCPPQKAGAAADGKIGKLGNFKFTYYSAPPSMACTKISTDTICKWGAEECKLAAAVDPITNLYVKTTVADPKKCEITTSPKILG